MPVCNGKLKKENKGKICKNLLFLVEELDGGKLVNHMVQEKVFDFHDKEEICSLPSGKKRTEKFIDKLLDAGRGRAYAVFLWALRELYPHVAQRLEEESQPQERDVRQNSELRPALPAREKPPTIISSFLVSKYDDIEASHQKCKKASHFDLWNFFIPALSFDKNSLPEEFRYTDVLDYIKSLAKQTVMACVLRVSKYRPSGYPRHEWKRTNELRSGDGILWSVHRSFKYEGNEPCPCEDCAASPTPKRYWGAYIVLTSKTVLYDASECLHSQFLLGYDSFEDIPNVLVLSGVEVTSSDTKLNFSEVLCVSHDVGTCKRVEDICKQTCVNREKLLGRLHRSRMGKTLAVRISHSHEGPKQICVGEWLTFGEYGASEEPGHFYTSAVCKDGGGGPVLFVNDSRAFISLHDTWDENTGVGRSSGKIWSL